jgi:hypothetical protein
MKRNIILTSIALFSATTLLFTGCSKDDTTGPVIALNGATSVEVSLGSGAWSDPGATATDDEDGSVTVTSDASSTNPNTNLIGSYTITYTATDAAGNTSYETRTVRVKNDAETFAGNYNVHDTCPGVPAFIYTQTITVDSTENNKIHFNRFGDYANNTTIYAMMTSSGTLNMPSQTALNIGSGAGTCDIATHNFQSVSSSNTSTGFTMVYIDQITSPSSCISTTQCTATYTKQ